MEFVLFQRSILRNFGHSEPVLKRFQYQFFRETRRLLRETTHRFTPQLQSAKNLERAGTAVYAKGVDTLVGHRDDGVVTGLGCLPTGPAGVADGKNQDALLGQSIFDSKRIAVVKLFAPGFSSRTEDSSHSILHSFLDRLTTSAFAPLRMK